MADKEDLLEFLQREYAGSSSEEKKRKIFTEVPGGKEMQALHQAIKNSNSVVLASLVDRDVGQSIIVYGDSTAILASACTLMARALSGYPEDVAAKMVDTLLPLILQQAIEAIRRGE